MFINIWDIIDRDEREWVDRRSLGKYRRFLAKLKTYRKSRSKELEKT
jgi:hypothetical protein